jgi:hypothetical protein
MTQQNPNPFDGRSPDWIEGYKAGVDGFAAEMKWARERGLNLEKRPVAFRVKGQSGWMLFEREESAIEAAKACGGDYQGLYVRGESHQEQA